jgi:hypothetical protein
MGFIALLVFFKWLILSDIIYPLNPGGDAATYYNYMLHIDNFWAVISDIYYRFSIGVNTIVPSGGLLFYVPSQYFHTIDMYMLTFVNHLLLLVASWMFAKTLVHLKLLDEKYFYIFILLVNLSPLVNRYGSYLLKEVIVIFFVGVTVYFYYVKKNLPVVVLSVIIVSMARPYFPFIFLSYWFLFHKKASMKFFIQIIIFELIFLYLYSGGLFAPKLVIKNTIIAWGGFMASPNFLRITNWEGGFLSTLESLIIFLSYVLLLFSRDKSKNLIFASLLIYSLTLGTMAMQADLTGFETNKNALTKVDVGRKKLPIMFINYYVFFLLYRRFRLKEPTVKSNITLKKA